MNELSERTAALVASSATPFSKYDWGYLQHGSGSKHGPFSTESVRIKNEGPTCFARYEGRWRKVHMQVNRLFIVYQGERITITIHGV